MAATASASQAEPAELPESLPLQSLPPLLLLLLPLSLLLPSQPPEPSPLLLDESSPLLEQSPPTS
ncbi:MAG: hypothetical protein FJ125_15170 [Deltaproteobacteria bacterium]|nr:hypothetical protein [Deltaproteobacteria bacterium]